VVSFYILKETNSREWGMTFLWTSRMQGMKPMYIPILPQFAINPENNMILAFLVREESLWWITSRKVGFGSLLVSFSLIKK
jgi:hypothetical protein